MADTTPDYVANNATQGICYHTHSTAHCTSTYTTLPSGISFSLETRKMMTPCAMAFEIDEAPLHISYQRLGHTRSSIRFSGKAKKEMEFRQGDNGLGYMPESCGTIVLSGESCHRAITLFLSSRLLETYMQGSNCKTKTIEKIVAKEKNVHLMHRCKNTPTKNMLLHQLENMPPNAPLRTMRMDALCMELASLQLAEFLEEPTGNANRLPLLSPQDKRRIREARDILIHDLENPPSLVELARTVGINDFKLKQGFRALYGTTVYGYYRDYRLDKAREHLEQGDMNVSQVAYSIGYLNIGHFGQAFYKRFGMLPKHYRKQYHTPA